jgi:hypothetical protein
MWLKNGCSANDDTDDISETGVSLEKQNELGKIVGLSNIGADHSGRASKA